MIIVRHRSVSSRLDSMWEFDCERSVVDLVICLAGAKPLALTFKVCSPHKPRLWSHGLLRHDDRAWRILPAMWRVAPTSKVGDVPELIAAQCGGRGARPFPCDLHAIIGDDSHLVLTCAPTNIDQELMELDSDAL